MNNLDGSTRPIASLLEDTLRTRAKALNLFGLLANWEEAVAAGRVQALLDWEDQERARRSPKRTFSVSDKRSLTNAASVPLISDASNPCATSTGTGQKAATVPASKR